MEFSYYSKPLSISLFDECMRKLLVYLPLVINLYYLRKDYLPTFMETTTTSTIKWIFEIKNLPEPLSILGFVMTLLTFQRQYVFRRAKVDKNSRTVRIWFYGKTPALVNLGQALLRLTIYIFGYDEKMKALMQSKYLVVGLVMLATSLTSIAYSYWYSLFLSNTRMVFYLKISRGWRYIHSIAIIALFLYVCFFHSNGLIQIIFRTTFLITSFLHVFRLQRKFDTFVKLEFVNNFVNSKVLFLIISTFLFFEGFKILEYNIFKKSIETSFSDERTHEYVEALILFLICCRQRLYFEMYTLLPNMLYGVSLDHPLLRAAFPQRAPILVRDRSQFYTYFMEKVLHISGLVSKDVLTSAGEIKDGFLKDMLQDNREVRERFSELLKTRFGRDDQTQSWRRLGAFGKVKMFFLGMLASFVRNIEPVMKIFVQISCMFYIYSITEKKSIDYFSSVANTVFGFILTYWSLFSYKLNAPESMLKFTTYLIFPTLVGIQCLNMLNFYQSTFILKTGIPQPATVGEWLLLQNETAMSVLVFLFTLVSTVTANRLQVKNNLVIEIKAFVQRFSQLWASNPWEWLIDALTDLFFSYFNYLITSLTILTTMLDVNIINLCLMFFSIAFLTLRNKHNQGWIYFAFSLDLLVLVKVVISTIPKHGMLNNIELLAILGVYTLPQENNSTFILFLMTATMITCYYIYYVDGYVKALYKKKFNLDAPPIVDKKILKRSESMNDFIHKPSEIRKLITSIFRHSQKYILLSYHGALLLLLILDNNKDFFTLYLFTLEAVIIPIHLLIYLRSNSEHPPYSKLYRFFLPIFVSALIFVVLRYILFFQRFAFFNHIYINFRNKYGSIVEFNMKRDASWNERRLKATFFNFDIEFFILVITIFSMIRLRSSEQEERKKENRESEIPEVKQDITEDYKRSRALKFLAWNFLSQFILCFLMSKSMTNRPNLIKTGIIAIWMLYIVGLFRSLSSGLDCLNLFEIMDQLFDYFRQTFITRMKATDTHDANIGNRVEEKERMQIRAYYGIVLKEFEDILRVRNRMISFILTVGCLWLNWYTLATHTLSRYYGVDKVKGMVWLLSFDPISSAMVENDLVYTHVLILWFLIDVGMYITYYSGQAALLTEWKPELRLACVRSLTSRFDYHLLEKTKANASSFLAMKSAYDQEMKKFSDLVDESKDIQKILITASMIQEKDSISPHALAQLETRRTEQLANSVINIEDEQEPEVKAENKSSPLESQLTGRQSELTTVSPNPAKQQTEIIYLSDHLSSQDKILYIYINRNKYYYCRMIRSVFFNIPRIAMCCMVANLIYSQTVPDYFLVIICIVYSLRACRRFYESTYFILIIFGMYFLVNWMFIRYDRLDWTSYLSIVNLLAPSGPAKVSSFLLLLGMGVYNLGFAILLYYIYYACNSLLQVEKNVDDPLHFKTLDDYVLIDYKRWKMGTLNKMNFIFKMAHTVLIEIFALITFVTCFFIQGHTYFKTPVLVSVFLLIISEGLQNLKLLAKTLEETQKRSGASGFVGIVTKIMMLLCWTTMIVETWDVKFQLDFGQSQIADLSVGVLIIYYMTLSVTDLIASSEYQNSRDQIKKEESLKTSLTALNITYSLNEEKIFARLGAFMGKDKLESMAKQCIFEKDFAKVKLHMEYNSPTLVEKLDGLYLGLQKTAFSGVQFVRQRLLHSIYSFLNANMNHFRYMDFFVLYRNIIRRNQDVLPRAPVDLSLYFRHDYKQFESLLRDVKIYYEHFKERDTEKLEFFSKKMEEFEEQIRNNEFISEKVGKTYKELSDYEWVKKKNEKEVPNAELSKRKEDLLSAAHILLRELTRSIEMEGGNVLFESLKVELNKKGYVECTFGNTNIVLYNLRNDLFAETQGFLLFRFRPLMFLITSCITSNVELCVAVCMAAIAAFNGGAINFVILGVIIFAVMIEETYGNLTWWKVAYIIFLIKLFLQVINLDNQFKSFFLGSYLWTDILQTIMINIVMFQQRKIGFSDDYMFNIEDPGTCVVRLIANRDFDNFVERISKSHQKKLETLVAYIEQKFRTNITQEAYRALKTACTFAIGQLYLNIERYKGMGKDSALKLFRRLKEDTFTNSLENGNRFFWRNFSAFSRKPGIDLSPVIYLLLTSIIFLVILLLQSEESGRNVISNLFSGSQAISSQTVITIMIYVTLLFLEKFFFSMAANDTIGTRYNEIYVDIWKNVSDELQTTHSSKKKTEEKIAPLSKVRKAVRKLLLILNMKAKRRSTDDYKNNPLYYKFFLMIFFWVVVNFMVYVVQPVVAYANRNALFEGDLLAFMCEESQPTCYSYNNMVISKIFYFLNICYIMVAVQQMRKGKLMAMPQYVDYSSLWDEVKYYLYYKPPILREICTLIEYSSQNTTLEIDDWLLCEDLKEYMINAKISHSTNEVKNTGELVQKAERVSMTMVILIVIVGMMIIPLFLFSKFTSGDKEQQIVQGSMKLTLYAGDDRFVTNLYRSSIMLENRDLNSDEVDTLSSLSTTRLLDRAHMNVISFSPFSDTYLDTEESSKANIIQHILNSTDPFIILSYDFTTEDKLNYKKEYRIPLADSLKENIVSIVFAQCASTENSKSSELFVMMLPQILEFSNKNIEEKNIDPTFTQKLGLSLRCDTAEKKSYIWIMTVGRPTFYVILVPKNDAYEFISKYLKLENLTLIGLYSLIFGYLAIRIIRPAIFGQSVNLGFTEMPRNQIIVMILDAMHFARLDRDLLLEDLLFERLQDIMRDYDEVYRVTDSTMLNREKNLYERYKSLQAKDK